MLRDLLDTRTLVRAAFALAVFAAPVVMLFVKGAQLLGQ